MLLDRHFARKIDDKYNPFNPPDIVWDLAYQAMHGEPPPVEPEAGALLTEKKANALSMAILTTGGVIGATALVKGHPLTGIGAMAIGLLAGSLIETFGTKEEGV